MPGIWLTMDDDVEAPGNVAFTAQQFTRPSKARSGVIEFIRFGGVETDLVGNSFAAEVQRNLALIYINRLPSSSVKNANRCFGSFVIDDQFRVIVFVSQNDQAATIWPHVGMAFIVRMLIGGYRWAIMIVSVCMGALGSAGCRDNGLKIFTPTPGNHAEQR